jgi:hypothetical protein
MEPAMSEEIERTLGRIESTMQHFGASLEEVKDLVRGGADSTGDLRLEVTRGIIGLQGKQASHETETARRFRGVDKRFESANGKLDTVRSDLARHERIENSGEAHAVSGRSGRTAAVGAAGAGGAVGGWWILQRLFELFGSTPPPGGH